MLYVRSRCMSLILHQQNCWNPSKDPSGGQNFDDHFKASKKTKICVGSCENPRANHINHSETAASKNY